MGVEGLCTVSKSPESEKSHRQGVLKHFIFGKSPPGSAQVIRLHSLLRREKNYNDDVVGADSTGIQCPLQEEQ